MKVPGHCGEGVAMPTLVVANPGQASFVSRPSKPVNHGTPYRHP